MWGVETGGKAHCVFIGFTLLDRDPATDRYSTNVQKISTQRVGYRSLFLK